jgi:nitrite reductase (NADH) small subunit
MSDFVTVAKVGAIPDGKGLGVEVGGRAIAVFHLQGQYFAIDDRCPHMGASLAEGDVAHGCVSCPLHEWRFQIDDGTWCDDRRLKIDRFAVRVVGQEIQVRPVPE